VCVVCKLFHFVEFQRMPNCEIWSHTHAYTLQQALLSLLLLLLLLLLLRALPMEESCIFPFVVCCLSVTRLLWKLLTYFDATWAMNLFDVWLKSVLISDLFTVSIPTSQLQYKHHAYNWDCRLVKMRPQCFYSNLTSILANHIVIDPGHWRWSWLQYCVIITTVN